MAYEIGDKVKDFTLPNSTDQNVSLSDFQGKWIVLYFYPKDNTSGCTAEAKDFTCQIEEFGELNCAVIGVSPDQPKSHLKFISNHDLKIELLSDVEHNVLEAFDAWGLKKMYGKEYYGVIRSTYIISPDGEIKALWKKVKVKGHVDDVLARLKEFQG